MSVDSEAQFGENLSESSSEGCCQSSEASFCSASEDFLSYDDSAEPVATEEEATQAVCWTNSCTEEAEPEDMLLSRFADETDLSDWYFIWFLRLDSFCFYQCVYSLNCGLLLLYHNQSGRTPVLEEAMTSLFYCFARKSQKINPRKIWLSEKLDSRFHRLISENIKASLSNVPWARVGNFWQSESIKSLSFWKGLRRSRRHFDRHRM